MQMQYTRTCEIFADSLVPHETPVQYMYFFFSFSTMVFFIWYLISLDDLLDSNWSRWIDPMYLLNSMQYPPLFGCHFFKIDKRAVDDMTIFYFCIVIIVWWEGIDMFRWEMDASKVVFLFPPTVY